MEIIYLDRDQCKRFHCPYFEAGQTVIAADTLLNSKFYDSAMTAGLVMAGQHDLVLARNASDAPGWYSILKVTQKGETKMKTHIVIHETCTTEVQKIFELDPSYRKDFRFVQMRTDMAADGWNSLRVTEGDGTNEFGEYASETEVLDMMAHMMLDVDFRKFCEQNAPDDPLIKVSSSSSVVSGVTVLSNGLVVMA